jgi:putative ATPase
VSDLLSADHRQWQPLAARMRPRNLEEYAGQSHLLGDGCPLRKALEQGQAHSMILWGPPGVGKTTLAHLMASYIDAQFLTLSAVLSGVKEIRAAIDEAKYYRQQGRLCLLFVDEVHRFNKSQQDAFLPHIEDGTVIFVGATTENPSFELNGALLSRARVYVLKPLDATVIADKLRAALTDVRGLADAGIDVNEKNLAKISLAADGDMRRGYNLLEVAVSIAQADGSKQLSDAIVEQALGEGVRRFDKGGDQFYDQISALHKSVRGSSPDGALYWFVRMIDGGCDPLYIARRVVRMASEDIGNADPRALTLALNAWDVQERLGSPEGELAIAQAIVFMACAAKSNAVYTAFNAVKALVRAGGSLEVPLHLRNAPTKLMKAQGYGEEYRYAHDYPDGYAAGEKYLPADLADQQWYAPVPRGLEIKIGEKLKFLRQLDKESDWHRYNDDAAARSKK